MALCIDIFNPNTLLDRKYLSLRVIDEVFAELAMLLLGVQLVLFEKRFYYLYKL